MDAARPDDFCIIPSSRRSAKTLTDAHGPLDTPRWSYDNQRIAFLYSEGAPRTPGPLNPLARDSGVLSASIYEQRLAIVPASGGELKLLGPKDLNIYEYDSPGVKLVVAARSSSWMMESEDNISHEEATVHE